MARKRTGQASNDAARRRTNGGVTSIPVASVPALVMRIRVRTVSPGSNRPSLSWSVNSVVVRVALMIGMLSNVPPTSGGVARSEKFAGVRHFGADHA